MCIHYNTYTPSSDRYITSMLDDSKFYQPWISISAIELIVNAANRSWERGESEHWYNANQMSRRGDAAYVNGRPA